MKGHEPLIKMRLAGYCPEAVFLMDCLTPTDWFEKGDQPTVCVYEDSISSMDLRFVMGMTVHINSNDPKRAKAMLLACKQNKAKLIGALAGSYMEIWNGESK